jgi:hypothetical protein
MCCAPPESIFNVMKELFDLWRIENRLQQLKQIALLDSNF